MPKAKRPAAAIVKMSAREREIPKVDTALVDAASGGVKIPEFPHELAWRYPLSLYRDAVGPHTESPDEFHYASAITIIGLMIGRGRHFRYPTPHFPNLFSCLVGPTAKAKKTTAMGLARAEILAPFLDLNKGAAAHFHVEYSLGGSGEGILEKLADGDSPAGGNRMLLYVPEFSGLLRKMRQNGSTLHPLLLQAADAEPTITLSTRRKPLTATSATVSMLAGSTASWIEADVSEDDIRGGLVNRIMWFYGGGEKEAIAIPQGTDRKALHELRTALKSVVDMRPPRRSQPLQMTEEAVEFWTDWYQRIHDEEPLSPVVGAITARRHGHAIRLAILYASLANSLTIETEHLQAAVAVADYCAQVVSHLFLTISPDLDARIERDIVAYLLAARTRVARNHGGAPKVVAVRIKKIHQMAAPRASADRFNKLLKALAAAHYVGIDWARGVAWTL